MGKLNVNVTVEGVEYRKVDREAQAGDIIRFEDAPFTLITAGGFYVVNEIDSCGDAQITNDDGGSYDTCGDTFEVYEKVAEKAAVPARLTIGDYARILPNASGRIRNHIGQIAKITTDDGDEPAAPYKLEDNDGVFIGRAYVSEVERATEAEFLAQKQPKPSVEAPQDDVVTHRGVRYRKEVRATGKGIESGALIVITKEHANQPFKTERGAKLGAALVYNYAGSIGYDTEAGVVYYGNAALLIPVKDDAIVVYEGRRYRKVARKANVGELVLVVESFVYGSAGDIATVTKSPAISGDVSTNMHTLMNDIRYVVLEPLVTEVNRTARVGERIRIVAADTPRGHYANGSELTVTETGIDGKAYFTCPDGGRYFAWAAEYVVLEDVEPAAIPAKPQRLKVGDYVKVTKHGGGHNYEIGEIVKVTKFYGGVGGDNFGGIKASTGKEGNCLLTEQTVPATEVEYMAVCNKESVSVGDSAVLTKMSGCTAGFNVGDRVKVVELSGSRYTFTITKNNGRNIGYASAEHLRRLTEEEIAEAAVTAKWSAIGRKVNEYKAGDVVIAKRSNGNNEFIYGEVEDARQDTEKRLGLRLPNGSYFATYSDGAKLVTPVEQRFDKR